MKSAQRLNLKAIEEPEFESLMEDVDELLKGFDVITEFFGCPIHRLDPLVRAIAFLGSKPFPEWLRGVRTPSDLPRWSFAVTGNTHDLGSLRLADRVERLRWIVENCSETWILRKDMLHFESETDSLYYYMRWHEY